MAIWKWFSFVSLLFVQCENKNSISSLLLRILCLFISLLLTILMFLLLFGDGSSNISWWINDILWNYRYRLDMVQNKREVFQFCAHCNWSNFSSFLLLFVFFWSDVLYTCEKKIILNVITFIFLKLQRSIPFQKEKNINWVNNDNNFPVLYYIIIVILSMITFCRHVNTI